MKRPAFVLFVSCVFSLSLLAQRYSFKNYTTHDGLVQTDITDIEQDRSGNIWIGTAGGISIFDGKKFTNYDDHDVLQSLRINALLCDANGVMWVATGNGLLRYGNGFSVFFKPNRGFGNWVSSLTANSQNLLLFVCNNQLYQVKAGKVEKYSLNARLDAKTLLAAFDRNDNLWIVTIDMAVYKKTVNQLTAIRTPFTEKEVRSGLGFLKILGKDGPEPYFVTNFGTFCVQNDSLCYFAERYPAYAKAKIGAATYALEENDSTLWVGGVTGLSKLSGTAVHRYATENGFCDNSVSCLFTDREHNLWIGCTYNGVYKLSNEALFHLKPPAESFDLRHISATAPLSADKTLLASWGKGLYLYTGDSVSKLPLPPRIRYIITLLPTAKETYIGWFGPGIWRMDNATKKVDLLPNFARDEAISTIERLGSRYVVQAMNGTCYLTDASFRVIASATQPDEFYITVLTGKIFRTSPFGQVDMLNPNTLDVVKRNLFPEITSTVTQIACFQNHFLVATFGQGLFFYNAWGKLLKRLDKKNGLPTNIITGLQVDDSRLYMGTNLGMMRADLPDLRNLKIFTEAEGLFNWECRQRGLRKLPNGSLLVSTTNGPYLYYPSRDPSAQYASGVLTLSSVACGENKTVTDVASLDGRLQVNKPVDYKDNTVVVTLHGVSQRNPDGVLYHYQLAGYDSAWTTTQNPVLTFAALSPGDYTLKAYLSVGGFQSKPLLLNFSVARPLSGQLWFQVLLVLFLSGLCWTLLTVGNRIYQKYIQTKMVTRLEADVAQKQRLTAQSMAFARHQFGELGEVLRQQAKEGQLQHLTPVFLKDVSRRIELLWKKESLTLGELHQYFDELLSDYGNGARLYHKLSTDEVDVPVQAAFPLLQVFSLYLFISLYENGTAVFSLDSENNSSGRVLLRLYNMTHENGHEKISSYHLLKETVSRQPNPAVTVDVIENLEYGNMIIAELNLHSAN